MKTTKLFILVLAFLSVFLTLSECGCCKRNKKENKDGDAPITSADSTTSTASTAPIHVPMSSEENHKVQELSGIKLGLRLLSQIEGAELGLQLAERAEIEAKNQVKQAERELDKANAAAAEPTLQDVAEKQKEAEAAEKKRNEERGKVVEKAGGAEKAAVEKLVSLAITAGEAQVEDDEAREAASAAKRKGTPDQAKKVKAQKATKEALTKAEDDLIAALMDATKTPKAINEFKKAVTTAEKARREAKAAGVSLTLLPLEDGQGSKTPAINQLQEAEAAEKKAETAVKDAEQAEQAEQVGEAGFAIAAVIDLAREAGEAEDKVAEAKEKVTAATANKVTKETELNAATAADQATKKAELTTAQDELKTAQDGLKTAQDGLKTAEEALTTMLRYAILNATKIGQTINNLKGLAITAAGARREAEAAEAAAKAAAKAEKNLTNAEAALREKKTALQNAQNWAKAVSEAAKKAAEEEEAKAAAAAKAAAKEEEEAKPAAKEEEEAKPAAKEEAKPAAKEEAKLPTE